MRFLRPLPLALLIATAVTAPASAADQAVTVQNFQFTPDAVEIDPGDSVTWNFQDEAKHTSSSSGGQAERWASGLSGRGESFTREFSRPGRWQYICEPHPNMTGTVQVGEDAVAKSFSGAKAKGSARAVKVSFRLREAAKVTVSADGPRDRKATKRLKPGRRSITVKRLRAGDYRVKIVATDDFDKRTTKRVRAQVG